MVGVILMDAAVQAGQVSNQTGIYSLHPSDLGGIQVHHDRPQTPANVDKGDRVKRGQLVALLDSPKLDHQTANARATYNFAQLTDKRNQSLLRLAVLAPQQADQSHAQMLEAEENLDQLVSMQAYKEIRAPSTAS
jgi:Biotin-lipoyl like